MPTPIILHKIQELPFNTGLRDLQLKYQIFVSTHHFHEWFATSHARILEHRLEVGLCSCTI